MGVWKRKSVKRVFELGIFFLMLYNAFSHVTYLFRNASFSDRAFIQGFHSAEKDPIDVVYIGGSNVYCYYDPMIAWNEYGITSYCYSVPQMDAAVMLSAVKDIYKEQSPKLVICDVRKFLSEFWYDEITMGVREVLDSYDIGIERLMMVDYYRKISGLSVEETIPEYLDLVYYHTNYDVLSSPINWALTKNRVGGGYRMAG